MKNIIIIILAVVSILLAGNMFMKKDTAKTSDNQPFSGVTIRLAKQYGMQYATGYIVEKMNLLEKYLPGAKIEWSSFGGGAAITEALISGHLDVGFMGMPPAIIAIDKGADLKIASGVCVPPFDLMVKDSRLQSIADFKPQDKIAIPGISSTQHILLSIAAKDKLNKARDFDSNMIAMPNPEAYTSLLNGSDIVGHFTTMPFLEQEKRSGFRSILSGKEAYGDASIVCVTTAKFHNNPAVYAGLMGALNEAMDLINKQTPEVLKIIAEVESISIEDAKAFLDWPGTNYTANIYGLMGIANYMYSVGYIKNKPTLEKLLWENANALVGKRTGEPSAVEDILGK